MIKQNYFLLLLLALFLISCNEDSDSLESYLIENESVIHTAENDSTTFRKSNSEFFVTRKKALTVAKNISFESTDLSKERINSNKEIKEIFPVPDEKKNIVYYIINYVEGGFVILAADQRIDPILAYSENSYFRYKSSEYSLVL